MYCYNGDIQKFEQLLAQSKNVILQNKSDFLKQKVRILALLNYIFNKKSTERVISFNDISNICNISYDNVEYVLLHCLALNIIQGSINQTQQYIKVNWIQPTVLNNNQIQLLTNNLIEWNNKLEKTIDYIKDNARELIKVQ